MTNKKCELAGVTLIGIGGCGMNMMLSWLSKLSDDVLCIAINSDRKRLAGESRITHKIFLDLEFRAPTKERLQACMVKEMWNLMAVLENRNNIILLAGMGGLTGTWVSQLLCNELIAKGKKVVTVLVMPFGFERTRVKVAEEALVGFEGKEHQVLCLNDSLSKHTPEGTSFQDAFEIMNRKVFELILAYQ